MALLCSPSLFVSHHGRQPLLYSNESRILLNQRKCELKVDKISMVCSSCGASSSSSSPSSSRPSSGNGVLRRDLMLFGLCSSLASVAPISECLAEDDVKMGSMVDEINAYSYLYPMESPSKKFTFKWVESRKPERYSSAAPLSPDARLRIVSERVDIIDNLVISVSIGPPNVEFIKSKDKSSWNAKDVADSVLSDKSALVKSVTSLLHFRVTSSQRLAESSLLDAHTTEIDGQPYWVYEYLVRKSPTKNVQEPSLYRHYVASTFERDGYLYSLSASTLNKQWDKMGPFLERAVSSFRLLPPTDEYVPPFKDPWRFW
ncbi:unnamed protein product [Linum tenue]|uniref:PsbP C-terminal domain-containing protein n=1 Tax=Linum tenue TaxID=586396 RepID=A0AAV0MEA8_9ROSI|nr:unnamed protein product [Linum tenue]